MKKDASLRVRMTTREVERIRNVVGGRSVSRYIRACLLDYQASGPVLHEDLVALRKELSAIGNSLNQIAKKLNSGHELAGELFMEIELLPDVRKRLNDALSRVT